MIYYKAQAQAQQDNRETNSIGGLNKSHKAQRIANSVERVYSINALICYKFNRAEDQRNERRSKR